MDASPSMTDDGDQAGADHAADHDRRQSGIRFGYRVGGNEIDPGVLRRVRQLGAEDALVDLSAARIGEGIPSVDRLETVQETVEAAGLRFAGIHTMHQSTFDAIMFGTDGAQSQTAAIETLIRNLGAIGAPYLGYHWGMWLLEGRTGRKSVRGGAGGKAWDAERAGTRDPPAAVPDDPIDEEDLWDNYARFLDRVVPVAEEAGVRLAVHPADPPLVEDADGVPRLLRSVEAFDRAMDLHDSRHHAIKLCLGCFAEMDADVVDVIRRYGKQDRIGFVHFRNVAGAVPSFRETFVDGGDFDPVAAMRALHEVGFEGPVLPDHVPKVDGDEDGVTATGYTLGYFRALRDALSDR